MNSRSICADELDPVLSQYDIGPLIAPPESGGGTANANITVETSAGRYFLKRRNPKYAQRSFVAFDHRLMEHLAAYEIGTPLAAKTRDGERWSEWNGCVYELFPFQPGCPHDRHSLAQLYSAGSRLAEFHRAVRSFPVPEGKAWPRYHDPALIRKGVEAITVQLRSRLTSADYAYLEAQVALLEREFADERYQGLPKVVVHGDYHPGNVLYSHDEVCGIFDLDWATLQPRVLDLADGVFLFAGVRKTETDPTDIVSLTQTWQPALERARIFIDAYLRIETVTEEEWAVLELALRARWLYCRIGGMVKLPEGCRVDFVVDGLLAPLRALDEGVLWDMVRLSVGVAQ
jgi:Ser/Thr protein kinase RdoA (MazF antagonist)